jgi:undecaprenyl pyrophosphate synthase
MENETTVISAKDKLSKIDQILDDYEKRSGLPQCKAPGAEEEFEKYLTMDRTEMEALQHENCAEIGYRLSQYAFYLQRLFNREKARVIWARQQLTDTIAKSLGDYDKFTKYDIKVALIIKENVYAESLSKIITYAEQRAQRLEFLATSLKNMADALKNMQMAKAQMARG